MDKKLKTENRKLKTFYYLCILKRDDLHFLLQMVAQRRIKI